MIRKRSRAGLASALLALVLGIASVGVWGQAFPNRPVRIIVPFAKGNTADVIARALAPQLSIMWRQPVTVENRPGQTGIAGAELVARAPNDGHTLLLTAASHAAIGTVLGRANFDPLRDFVPVSWVASVPGVLVAHPAFPARSARAVIDIARSSSGSVICGSAGPGTSQHLAAVLFEHNANLKFQFRQFASSAQAGEELVSGGIQVLFDTVPGARRHIEAGRARPIAVTSARRSALFPDVPTMAEAGVPGYQYVGWYGLFAPPNTGPETIDKIWRQVARVVKLPAVRDKFVPHGVSLVGSTPEAFRDVLSGDVERWVRVTSSQPTETGFGPMDQELDLGIK